MITHQERVSRMAEFVAKRAATLQGAYARDDSAAVATLAILRSGAGTEPGSDPEVIRAAFAPGFFRTKSGTKPAETFFDALEITGDDVTREERAAYAALTLFAVHQQSRRGEAMHQTGYSLGRSARLLGRRSNSVDAVRRRFDAVGTASTSEETVHHARGLIQQLRQHRVPLDYGRFAKDLLYLHTEGADLVRLHWGRDFYRTHHAADDEPGEEAGNDSTPAA